MYAMVLKSVCSKFWTLYVRRFWILCMLNFWTLFMYVCSNFAASIWNVMNITCKLSLMPFDLPIIYKVDQTFEICFIFKKNTNLKQVKCSFQVVYIQAGFCSKLYFWIFKNPFLDFSLPVVPQIYHLQYLWYCTCADFAIFNVLLSHMYSA